MSHSTMSDPGFDLATGLLYGNMQPRRRRRLRSRKSSAVTFLKTVIDKYPKQLEIKPRPSTTTKAICALVSHSITSFVNILLHRHECTLCHKHKLPTSFPSAKHFQKLPDQHPCIEEIRRKFCLRCLQRYVAEQLEDRYSTPPHSTHLRCPSCHGHKIPLAFALSLGTLALIPSGPTRIRASQESRAQEAQRERQFRWRECVVCRHQDERRMSCDGTCVAGYGRWRARDEPRRSVEELIEERRNRGADGPRESKREWVGSHVREYRTAGPGEVRYVPRQERERGRSRTRMRREEDGEDEPHGDVVRMPAARRRCNERTTHLPLYVAGQNDLCWP